MTSNSFTVIIPNLQQGDFLERALCSVIDQGSSNLQIIVVSADEQASGELRNRYGASVKLWLPIPQATWGAAVNAALPKATGDYICILPDSAIMLPGVLQRVSERLQQDDRPRWLVGSAMRIDEFDRVVGRIRSSQPSSLLTHLMHDSGVLPIAASFYHRAMLKEIGPVDQTLQQAYALDLHARLMEFGYRPSILAQTLVCVREDESRRGAEQTLQYGQELISVAERHAEDLPLSERYALWANCDRRRRIYTLAEAELKGHRAKKFLLGQCVRHPWWLSDEHFRHAVMHGVEHPLCPEQHKVRPAA